MRWPNIICHSDRHHRHDMFIDAVGSSAEAAVRFTKVVYDPKRVWGVLQHRFRFRECYAFTFQTYHRIAHQEIHPLDAWCVQERGWNIPIYRSVFHDLRLSYVLGFDDLPVSQTLDRHIIFYQRSAASGIRCTFYLMEMCQYLRSVYFITVGGDRRDATGGQFVPDTYDESITRDVPCISAVAPGPGIV